MKVGGIELMQHSILRTTQNILCLQVYGYFKFFVADLSEWKRSTTYFGRKLPLKNIVFYHSFIPTFCKRVFVAESNFVLLSKEKLL